MGCLQDAYATYIKLAKLWDNYSHTDGQRLANGQWFKKCRRFTQRDIQPYGKCGTIESFVKFGWIVLSFSMLETAFRNMLYAIEGKKPSNEFYKVYKQLLDATAVNPSDEQKSAVRLFQLTRNTVHNNGIYNGSKEEVVTFGGAGFLFKPGYKVDYASFSILFPMVEEIEGLVVNIIESNKVQSIQSIDDNPRELQGIKSNVSADGSEK